MKKMTCKDMGGPCDAEMSAATPEEMKKMGGEHVTTVQDDAHKAAAEMMKSSTPEAMAKWEADFAAKYAAAPEVA